jgi:hypothetical protein
MDENTGGNVGGQAPVAAPAGGSMGMKIGLGLIVLAVLVGAYFMMSNKSDDSSNIEEQSTETGNTPGSNQGTTNNGTAAGTITTATEVDGTVACDKYISVAELEGILGVKFSAPVSGQIGVNGSATTISGCTWKLASDSSKQIGFGLVDGQKMNIPVESIEKSIEMAITQGGTNSTVKKLSLPDHAYIASETNGDTTGLIFKTTSYGGVTAHNIIVGTSQMSQILIKIAGRI